MNTTIPIDESRPPNMKIKKGFTGGVGISAPLLRYLLISIGVGSLTALLYFTGRVTGFSRFLGPVNPIAAVSLLVAAGAWPVYSLQFRGWPSGISRAGFGSASRTAGIALLFFLPTMCVDIAVPYPESINILLPESAAFYPFIGFAVEVLFHLIPVFILQKIFQAGGIGGDVENKVIPVILLAALCEPAFHVLSEAGAGYPLWRTAYVGVHNYLFNVYQLRLFRRRGFCAMYLFRLVYYLLWHVVWGHVRLEVLF